MKKKKFLLVKRNYYRVKIINQKKGFEKFFYEKIPHYSISFNNKILKIIISTITYSFGMKLSYVIGEDSIMNYILEFPNCTISIDLSNDIYIDIQFSKYSNEKIDLRSNFFYIFEYLKYYIINGKNRSLNGMTINNIKMNIQNNSEYFFYRNVYIYSNHFDFILATNDFIMFLESSSHLLYIKENNINFDLFKREFRSGFELFLRNNKFDFMK